MVSIVIPNYNKFALLKNCIMSILNGLYKNFEIIVVDNGSANESRDIILDEKITYIWLPKNMGFSYAVNEGIRQSKAKYIALLNNDTEVSEDWLQKVVDFFEDNQDIMYITSKIKKLYSKDYFDDVGDVILSSGKVYKIGYSEKDIGQYDIKRYIFGASGCASVYRREFFDCVGYFDEDFFAYLEDIDLSFRANLLGFKCIYLPDAVVYHVGSATTGSQFNGFTVFYLAQNTINVIVKNYPAKLLCRNFILILNHIISLQVFFLIKGFGSEYFKGLISGLRSYKKMMNKRHQIAKLRVLNSKNISELFAKNKKLYKVSRGSRR